MEAVVLAGGRGTRLSGVLPEGLPKPLAPVAGRAFLDWLLAGLSRQGVTRCILSVGFGADAIIAHCGSRLGPMALDYCIEETPMGTGGAIALALAQAHEDSVLVLNGDTWLGADYAAMAAGHARRGARLSIACVAVPDTSRYGRVRVEDGTVVAFEEKGAGGPGLINGGSYLVDRDALEDAPSGPFSFEQDFLVPRVSALRPAAFVVDAPFLDIGVPADLARAQQFLPQVAT